VLVVERWAELRGLHFVGKVPIQGARPAVRDRSQHRAPRAPLERATRYERAAQPSKLDPF
jgi:hypothetical protein